MSLVPTRVFALCPTYLHISQRGGSSFSRLRGGPAVQPRRLATTGSSLDTSCLREGKHDNWCVVAVRGNKPIDCLSTSEAAFSREKHRQYASLESLSSVVKM